MKLYAGLSDKHIQICLCFHSIGCFIIKYEVCQIINKDLFHAAAVRVGILYMESLSGRLKEGDTVLIMMQQVSSAGLSF